MNILYAYLAITLVIVAECVLDKRLTQKFDVDGIRTDFEDALLHWAQLPFRGALVYLAAHFIMDGSLILNFLALAAYYAFVFDALYNVWILKVSIFHVGTTARSDKAANWLFSEPEAYIILKFTLMAVFFIFLL